MTIRQEIGIFYLSAFFDEILPGKAIFQFFLIFSLSMTIRDDIGFSFIIRRNFQGDGSFQFFLVFFFQPFYDHSPRDRNFLFFRIFRRNSPREGDFSIFLDFQPFNDHSRRHRIFFLLFDETFKEMAVFNFFFLSFSSFRSMTTRDEIEFSYSSAFFDETFSRRWQFSIFLEFQPFDDHSPRDRNFLFFRIFRRNFPEKAIFFFIFSLFDDHSRRDRIFLFFRIFRRNFPEMAILEIALISGLSMTIRDDIGFFLLFGIFSTKLSRRW